MNIPNFLKSKGLTTMSEYNEVHTWLVSNYGRTRRHPCSGNEQHPGKKDWANIDGVYKKDIEHFTVLCKTCHNNLDQGFIDYDFSKDLKLKEKRYLRKNHHPLQFYFPELTI